MSSRLAIANGALSLVGAEAIRSLDERSREAKLCSDHFDAAFREALATFNWPEAKATRSLVKAADILAPSGAAYTYILPDDYVTAWYAGDAQTPVHYEIGHAATGAGLYLFSNEPSLLLTYTTSRTIPEQMSPQFIRAAEYILALRIVYPLTKKATSRDRIVREWDRAKEEIKVLLVNAEPEIVDLEFVPYAIKEQFS